LRPYEVPQEIAQKISKIGATGNNRGHSASLPIRNLDRAQSGRNSSPDHLERHSEPRKWKKHWKTLGLANERVVFEQGNDLRTSQVYYQSTRQ